MSPNFTTRFFYNQILYKQHYAEVGAEAELLQFENYTLPSFRLSSKTNLRYCKKAAKYKCVCFNDIV